MNSAFDKTLSYIFRKSFSIYQSQKYNRLKQIGVIVNLSEGMVIKKMEVCMNNLYRRLMFTQLFKQDLFIKYNIDINDQVISIDDQTAYLINKANKTNFSKEFILYILYVYLDGTFSIVGNINDVLLLNHKNNHFSYDCFLIEKRLADEFNFNGFINDIYTRLINNKKRNYSINLNKYLVLFLKSKEFFDVIYPLAKNIIVERFGLYINENDFIEIEEGAIKTVDQYVYNEL